MEDSITNGDNTAFIPHSSTLCTRIRIQHVAYTHLIKYHDRDLPRRSSLQIAMPQNFMDAETVQTTEMYNLTPRVICEDCVKHNIHGTVFCDCGTTQTNLKRAMQKRTLKIVRASTELDIVARKLRGGTHGSNSDEVLHGKAKETRTKVQSVIKRITEQANNTNKKHITIPW